MAQMNQIASVLNFLFLIFHKPQRIYLVEYLFEF